MTPHLEHDRDERGGGSGVMLILGTILAVLMVAGLVVDGGRKVSASADATAIAGQAARAAANAAATTQIAGGGINTSAAIAAANTYFAQAGISGTITIANNQVTARVTETKPTIFLSMVGVSQVTGTGTAVANLYATGQNP